jgi:suppressor of G2 allele of SKP1
LAVAVSRSYTFYTFELRKLSLHSDSQLTRLGYSWLSLYLPSIMNEAHKGQVALEEKNYPTAIAHLTAALKTSQSPIWLIQRSTAYQRNNQHELALADADNAVLAARSRGKRELIATAHFRRSIALHGLGRFGDARLCLHWAGKYNNKEKGLTIWVAKIKSDFDKAGGDSAECNQTTVKEIPDEVKEVITNVPKAEIENSSNNIPASLSSAGFSVQTPKDKVRQEWYQSTNTVTIEIFAKGIPREDAEVNIEEGSVSRQSIMTSNILTFTA